MLGNSEIESIPSLKSQPYESVDLKIEFAAVMAHFDGTRREMTPIGPTIGYGSLPVGTDFHCHTHYEMIYVIEGIFTQHLEKVKYCLNAGDVTFLGKSIRHFEGSETKSTCL